MALSKAALDRAGAKVFTDIARGFIFGIDSLVVNIKTENVEENCYDL